MFANLSGISSKVYFLKLFNINIIFSFTLLSYLTNSLDIIFANFFNPSPLFPQPLSLIINTGLIDFALCRAFTVASPFDASTSEPAESSNPAVSAIYISRASPIWKCFSGSLTALMYLVQDYDEGLAKKSSCSLLIFPTTFNVSSPSIFPFFSL